MISWHILSFFICGVGDQPWFWEGGGCEDVMDSCGLNLRAGHPMERVKLGATGQPRASLREQMVFLMPEWIFPTSALGPIGAPTVGVSILTKDTQPLLGHKISIIETSL